MVDRTTLDSEGRAITGEDLNLLEKLSAENRESVSVDLKLLESPPY